MAKRSSFNPFANATKKSQAPRLDTQVYQVCIERLSEEGQGVAQFDGKVTFVPGALVGETVEIRLVEAEKKLNRAKLIKVITPSELRVEPPCAHYQVCGGCQLQHLDLGAQSEFKRQRLSHWISVNVPEFKNTFEWIEGDAFGYRRRARVFAQKDRQGDLRVGYRKAGEHQIIDIHSCPVMSPDLAKAYRAFRDELSEKQSFFQPRKVYEYALAASDGEWAYQGLGDSGQHRRSKPLHYSLMGVDLQFYPEDFVQVNAALNEQMVEMAMDWLALTPNDRVLDLFCGIGNFTLPMAQKVEQVLGVEGLKHQVDQASANARQTGISNAQFILGDLFKPMSEQGWFNTGAYTKLLMDPGRQGAFDLVKTIGRLGVERMVYVSCNPSTLARDLPFILQAGYRVSKIAGLDVFPQTHHLEMMLLLTRK